MEILINGLPAAIKEGTSFQFITENRYFTGSDSYTLNIVFPLRGCSQNLRIFGHIGRIDVAKEQIKFDCEIRDRAFSRFGTITITSVSPEEVKTQFLEGRSEQNFASDFDNIYINEMNLGTPDSVTTTQTPDEVWSTLPKKGLYAALPWVNNASGNIQNKANYNASTGNFEWDKETEGLSCQPYLLLILKNMAADLGYKLNIRELSYSRFKNLIICNALPYAWQAPEFARALPHWTVTEFLEEIEKLVQGEFDIDHRAKRISFSFTQKNRDDIDPVTISRVVDAYTTEISEDGDGCEYDEAVNLAYADAGHDKWKFYSCPWIIDYFRHYRRSVSVSKTESKIVIEDWVKEFNTFMEMKEWAYSVKDTASTATSGRSENPTDTAKILYAKDIDTYFTFYTLSYDEDKTWSGISRFTFHFCLLPLNVFGDRIVNKESDKKTEIRIVPAWIDYTDGTYGDILFLDCGSLDSIGDGETVEGERGGRAYLQPQAVRLCQNGEVNRSEAYFDKIYVAFFNGYKNGLTRSYLPRPYIDVIDLRADFTYYQDENFSLRINGSGNSSPTRFKLNTQQKFTFSFLSHSIPDARALFYIEGRRYLCEKITSTFSENGMSELQKGVFYEVLEE